MANKPWIEAIKHVLGNANDPMSSVEIADEIVSRRLREEVGATPANTVASRISTSIRNKREKSPFVRIGRGQYSLRSKLIEHEHSQGQDSIDDEPVAGGVRAFGVYWSRNSVNWSKKPKLLGQQQVGGSTTVDMYGQIGVYLLFDQREVIYVGRATDQPIGKRLLEHTRDRISARWDRFSWFGLYAISEKGDLDSNVPVADSTSLISALEAVLIESLEPRQNRRRGDGFSGIEYIQKVDPEIERNKKKALLNELQQSFG
ncbi:MAG: hypothetical protein F4Y89_11830 [Gammaproteobacteria bacterium]|nr:hypothetical protein [Gammaproteobacteria bacterium]